jgi:hypothetical protein
MDSFTCKPFDCTFCEAFPCEISKKNKWNFERRDTISDDEELDFYEFTKD